MKKLTVKGLILNILLGITLVLLAVVIGFSLTIPSAFKNPVIQFDRGAFNSSAAITTDTFWTYKTVIGVEGSEQLVPALVTVYGENGEKGLRSIYKNDGSPSQWGYTIKVPALTTISSRFQRSLEYTVGPHMISKVFISWSDTSKVEWKNCKKELQW